MRIGECCNRRIVACDRTSSVCDLAQLMEQRSCSDAVVVDRTLGVNRPIGILTEHDLVVSVLARGLDPGRLALEDLIDGAPVTACVDDGFWETIERMRSRKIRRLVVVDRRGHLEGLLTSEDVLELLADAQKGTLQLALENRLAERLYRFGPGPRRVESSDRQGVADWARMA